MSGGGVELVVAEDPEAAALLAAQRLVAAPGPHVALSGGETPRRAYELAAALRPDWSWAQLWWGDERCVPPDDERSNYRLAREALLDRVEVPPAQVHRIAGERPAADAARAYDAELAGVMLDLALLGLGPDGHTASLFPGAPTLLERERRAVPAEPGLDPRVERVTLTVPALAARLVVFLVTGAAKAEAAVRAFALRPSEETPASLVRGAQTVAILDRAAAARLE